MKATYAIYMLRKSRRRRACDGSYFTVSPYTQYIGYADSLQSALSVASSVREVFDAPTFVSDFGKSCPTLEGKRS